MRKWNYRKLFRMELGSVLLILIGAVLLLNPDFGSAALASIVGWLMVGGGAAGLLIGILSQPVLGFMELAGSVLVLCFGIYLLRRPLMLASAIGVMLGLLLLSQGLGALREALQVKRYGGHYHFGLLFGIGMAAVGAYLIVSPLATSRFVMTLAGLVMVACGITNLINHHRASKWIAGSRKKIIGDPPSSNIIDADE